MRHIYLLTLISFLFLTDNITAQSVGINSDGSLPDASAMLDIKSSDKGLLIPRTDTTTVNGAGTPANGLLIYSPTDGVFYYYTSGGWKALGANVIIDEDGDTRVVVEQSSDDDILRFYSEGQEALQIKKGNGSTYMLHTDLNKDCVFLGRNAGLDNGLDSTFVNSAKFNTGIGVNSLSSNTNGLVNTAVGYSSLSNNETGNNNTAVGAFSLANGQSASDNTAVGIGSMQGVTTGSNNVAMGLNALSNITSGFSSVGIGRRSGVFDQASVGNVYLGTNAGAGGSTVADLHSKSNNVMVGYNSGEQAQGSSNVFLGYESGKDETGSNKLYIENSDANADNALIYGEFDNDIIKLNGKVIMKEGYTDADMDTKIEVEQATDEDEIKMTVAGTEGLVIEKNIAGVTLLRPGVNKNNTFFGYNSGLLTGTDSTFVNSGRFNTGVGYNTLSSNTNGLTNTAFGSFSLNNNETGSGNTAVGYNSMGSNQTSSNNCAFGSGSLESLTTGTNNVAIGLNASSFSTSGSNTVSIGRRAGVFDQSSLQNVFIGSNAGAGGPTNASVHSKSRNVMIGYNSGENAQGDDNVFLGHQSGQDETGNHKLYIENTNADSDNALIYGEFDNNLAKVNGLLGVGVTGSPTDQLHVSATGSEDAFRAQINGSTRFRIFNNGSIAMGTNNSGISSGDVYVHNDLGIGVSIPRNRFHATHNVDGDFVAKIENTNTDPKAHGLIVEIGASSNVETSNIFIAFQDQDEDIIGSVTGDNSGGVLFNTTSDRRLKTNIEKMESGLTLLDNIDAYTYEMKSNLGQKHIGFIAQELYKVIPSIVKGSPETTDVQNPMMVDYSKMTPVLVAALKEVANENKDLKSRVEQLEETMLAQQELVATLLTQLENTNESSSSKGSSSSEK